MPFGAWLEQHPRVAKLVGAVLVLMFVTVVLVEWMRLDLKSPLLPHGQLWQRILFYFMLLAVAGFIILVDASEIGKTTALKHGAIASAVAWFVAVPLGTISALVLTVLWCCLSIFLFTCAIVCWTERRASWSERFRLDWWLVLAATVAFLFSFTGPILNLVTHYFGAVIVYANVYLVVRSAWKGASSFVDPVDNWDFLTAVEKGSEEYEKVIEDFNMGAAAFAHKYPVRLSVGKVHKVTKAKTVRRTGEGRSLFHGTKRDNAQGILADGFHLPKRAGMFGKGIYFADCPLKSWQYTDGRPWRSGLILLCWVELGHSSHEKKANSSLSKPPSRSIMEWFRGHRKYESVVGDDHSGGGALRVPEYVIYDSARAEVDYVLECWSFPQGFS